MQKKLTVLFAFAIFVLVLGWAITPVQAHCKGKHLAYLPHCSDNDETDVARYDVTIGEEGGPVSGGSDSNNPWLECNQRGGKCIQAVSGVIGKLTLSYFVGAKSPFGDNG